MKPSYLSNSPDQTFDIGQKIGHSLKGNEVLLLSGDLGAGKTLITKGIATALNIDPDEVVSPTFTLMNRFEGRFTLYHLDLYRIGEAIQGPLPEIDDYINEGIIIVEWAQFLGPEYENLPNSLKINIIVSSEDTRKIEIQKI